ncbi:MAG: DMT family transporter [Methyloligellaceae bacterium]
MQNNMDRLSAAAAVLMLVTWALPGVFVRQLPELALLELSAWRLIPTIFPFIIILFLSCRFRIAVIGVLRDPMVLLASLFMTAYFTISNLAFSYAPIAVVALLISLAPLWVMLFEKMTGSRQSIRETAGASLAFAGLVICLWPGLTGADKSIGVMGIAGGLTCSFLSAAFVLISRFRNNGDSYRPMAATFFVFIFGIPLLLLSQFTEATYGPWNLEFSGYLDLIALGIISTAVPTLCYAFIGSRMPATVTALMNLLVPPAAAVAAWLFLGERLSPLALTGGAVSLGGLLLVVTRR